MKNILVLLLFFSSLAHSEVLDGCTYDIKDYVINVPNKKLSLDPNMPVGTIFYSYTQMNFGQSGTFTCAGNANQVYQQSYLNFPGGTLTSLSGVGAFPANTPVYKTNIPGVGVIISKGSTRPLPVTNAPVTVTGGKQPVEFRYGSLSVEVSLVKYDEIPPGPNMISLTSLPGFYVSTQFVAGTDAVTTMGVAVPINKPFTLARFSFGANTIEMLSATCDTPDVRVDLGKRNLTDTANREGGNFATPWVDASIRLTNCPVFYGVGGWSNRTGGSTKNNVMTLTLIPGNATTSTQGIMPVDNVGYAATGVGIQLAHGTASANTKVNFSSGTGTKTYTLNSTIGPTYTLPLVARYIQTASNINDIQTGVGKGKITYLVDYF
ncbi:fimbrial protein [Phytobacter ursingii]